MSLHNEQCQAKLTLIDLNYVELKYKLFLISLDKYNGSWNSVDGLSANML